MEKQQNYRLMVKVCDVDKENGQIDDLNQPVPGTVVIVKIDGDDILYLLSGREFYFWDRDRENAEVSASKIGQLWKERFEKKIKISKKEVEKFMHDIDSVVIYENE